MLNRTDQGAGLWPIYRRRESTNDSSIPPTPFGENLFAALLSSLWV
jgi:hypothetical protein